MTGTPAGGGTARLRALFHPRSIALIGASDNSGWSLGTFSNLRDHGFPGRVHLVNHRAEQVHGEPAHRALKAVRRRTRALSPATTTWWRRCSASWAWSASGPWKT